MHDLGIFDTESGYDKSKCILVFIKCIKYDD